MHFFCCCQRKQLIVISLSVIRHVVLAPVKWVVLSLNVITWITGRSSGAGGGQVMGARESAIGQSLFTPFFILWRIDFNFLHNSRPVASNVLQLTFFFVPAEAMVLQRV